MDYNWFYGSKPALRLLVIGAMLVFASCKSTEQAAEEMNAIDKISASRDTAEAEIAANEEDKKQEPVNAGIVITYRNKSSDVQVTLDPRKERFMLDLSGMAPSERDTVIIADSTLMKKRATDIQNLLAGYREAQEYFYLEEYNKALEKVNEILEIQETADGYALKGTIYFMMGNMPATRASWNKAVRINPDLPIPSIPELEEIIKDIKGENPE